MDGNKFKDCRFRINYTTSPDFGQQTGYFAIEKKCTVTEKHWIGSHELVERWRLMAFFKTREEARAHYELIKDLPEYLP